MQDKLQQTNINQANNESNEKNNNNLTNECSFAIQLKSELLKFELVKPDDKNYYLIKNECDYRKLFNGLERFLSETSYNSKGSKGKHNKFNEEIPPSTQGPMLSPQNDIVKKDLNHEDMNAQKFKLQDEANINYTNDNNKSGQDKVNISDENCANLRRQKVNNLTVQISMDFPKYKDFKVETIKTENDVEDQKIQKRKTSYSFDEKEKKNPSKKMENGMSPKKLNKNFLKEINSMKRRTKIMKLIKHSKGAQKKINSLKSVFSPLLIKKNKMWIINQNSKRLANSIIDEIDEFQTDSESQSKNASKHDFENFSGGQNSLNLEIKTLLQDDGEDCQDILDLLKSNKNLPKIEIFFTPNENIEKITEINTDSNIGSNYLENKLNYSSNVVGMSQENKLSEHTLSKYRSNTKDCDMPPKDPRNTRIQRIITKSKLARSHPKLQQLSENSIKNSQQTHGEEPNSSTSLNDKQFSPDRLSRHSPERLGVGQSAGRNRERSSLSQTINRMERSKNQNSDLYLNNETKDQETNKIKNYRPSSMFRSKSRDEIQVGKTARNLFTDKFNNYPNDYELIEEELSKGNDSSKSESKLNIHLPDESKISNIIDSEKIPTQKKTKMPSVVKEDVKTLTLISQKSPIYKFLFLVADSSGIQNKFDPLTNKHVCANQVNTKNKLGTRISTITTTKDSKYYFMSTTYKTGEEESMKICNYISQWSTKPEKLMKIYKTEHKGDIIYMEVSKNNKHLITIDTAKTLTKWKIQHVIVQMSERLLIDDKKGEMSIKLVKLASVKNSFNNFMSSAKISPCSEFLFISCDDTNIAKFNITNLAGGKILYENAHKTEIKCITISWDKKYLFSSDVGGNLKQWKVDLENKNFISNPKEIKNLKKITTCSILCMTVSLNSKSLYTGGDDKLLKQYSIGDNFRLLKNFEVLHSDWICFMSEEVIITDKNNNNNSVLFTVSDEGTQVQWNQKEQNVSFNYGFIIKKQKPTATTFLNQNSQ